MTTMISEVYDALKDAHGVSDEKARKAAEAVAQFDVRFVELKSSFEGLRGEFEKLKVEFEKLKGEFEKLKGEFEKLKGEVGILKWMVGFQSAMTLAVLLKLFIH